MMLIDAALIDRFLEGEVSQDEEALMMEWLEVPANLQRFARRSELHVDLRSSLRRRSIQENALAACDGKGDSYEPTAIATDSDQSAIPVPKPVGSRAKSKLVLLGLAVAASLFIALMLRPDKVHFDPSTEQVASVVARVDALLTKEDSRWDSVELVAGDYQLRRGLLHLQFDGGVMVYVESPAEFHVAGGKRLSFSHGRLSASVPPEGMGFTIDTPEAEVIDFGTEFSVDVESGASEVHVFDGLVRVQPKSERDGKKQNAVDLRTSQAVKIHEKEQTLVNIKIARDRFIRNFDEPRRNYFRSVRRLSPRAVYRMAIRDQGLQSVPPGYSGEVLTGAGVRPPHASGVFAGGALRVGDDSTGRGGRVLRPPALATGQLTVAVFVYLDAETAPGMIATNLTDAIGNFSLSIDEDSKPRASVRCRDGERRSVVSSRPLPLSTWRHVVVTVDGNQLRLYEDGENVASVSCDTIANSSRETLWFGTDAEGSAIWNGRIDEVALFDKALHDDEIAGLYQAALEEIARTK